MGQSLTEIGIYQDFLWFQFVSALQILVKEPRNNTIGSIQI